MNFTHLASKDPFPQQELLQRFDFYVVLFLGSQTHEDWVIHEIGGSLASEPEALCWVLTSKDIEILRPDSILLSIFARLRGRGEIGSSDSWLAWTTRDGLRDHDAPGGLIRMNFGTWVPEKSKKKLLEALNETMDSIKIGASSQSASQRSEEFSVGVAASLVASIIFELIKLPGQGLN